MEACWAGNLERGLALMMDMLMVAQWVCPLVATTAVPRAAMLVDESVGWMDDDLVVR